MLNARIRGVWDRSMRPVGAFVGRSGVNPNVLTVSGLVVQAVVAGLILDGRLVAAGALLAVAAVLDGLDGAVAKAQGRTSRFGALLDSTTDRLSDALVFLPVAWLYLVEPGRPGGRWVGALAMAAMVSSFLVSYVKARAEGLGYECNVGLIERAERMMAMFVALVFNTALPVVLALLTAASVWTFLQRLLHVHRQAAGAR